jgi:hypothetical protein
LTVAWDFLYMSKLNEAVTGFLFPVKVRPYMTFRNATVLAALAAVVTAVLRAVIRFPHEIIAKWESQNLLHSPLRLSLFYVMVAAVLLLVHATRHRASWYRWRVWVYCMVLAGALIAFVDLVFPLRSS